MRPKRSVASWVSPEPRIVESHDAATQDDDGIASVPPSQASELETGERGERWEDTVAPAPSPNPPEKKHAWAADYPEDTAPSRADWVGDEAERSTGSEDDYNEDPPATSGPVPGAGVTVAGAESAGAVARAYGSQAQGAAWATRTPLPRVLVVHTGGTLGMDSSAAPVPGGSYEASLSPAKLLVNLKQGAPEIGSLAHVDLKVAFNRDSSRVGPAEWVRLAKTLDGYRDAYDSFVVIHGTDTLSYTASALSLMLLGFGKPIVLTGSQLPLSELRSDARQNLIDAVTVATAGLSPASSPGGGLEEVVVVFGGRVLRGNRSQKTHSSIYQAFDSPGYPHLARLGIQIAWNREALLPPRRAYTPRLKRVPLDHEERASLDPHVLRVPIVPGGDPRELYGDLVGRGVRGIVLETFGVGNLPDLPGSGWLPFLRDQTARGLRVYLSTQCQLGELRPQLYRSGSVALQLGVDSAVSGQPMTPECACVKLMLCLEHPDLPMGVSLAGEL